MAKMRFMVTAGPTREYIDPVRFLSNASTGRMGYACAAAARRRGHEVTLISGPVARKVPPGVRFVPVVTADQMDRAVRDDYAKCDCVIMTAAVGDYRPRRTRRRKLQKSDDSLRLELVRTPDILAGLGRSKRRQILIGFAVQDRAARQNAERKCRAKNLDAVVLNSPAAFGAERIDAQILVAGSGWQSLPGISKRQLAGRLVRLAESLRAR
ncbi:MAG: phosphopantothenoylcysteine decarboxylase [Sedimentisphaerales bacterium]|nr:phosphopantothenoylcysteine decarboxylase [Sedimentisphaerales bacterium]